jgi:general secretion pathway protein F
LRAAADETTGRLARALRTAAAMLDQGIPLEEALASERQRMPAHVRGLLLAAARTGDMGAVLAELLAQRRFGRELRRQLWSALAYPALVVALTVAIFVVFQLVVFRPFVSMLNEFELQLPPLVGQTIWWTTHGVYVVVGLSIALPVLLLIGRLALGAVRWRRLLSTAPLFGPLWHWAGVAEMTRLLAVLLERQVPLPEALRLAGEGTGDANVRHACRLMSEGAAEGRPLSELIEESRRLPAALVPLAAWGERAGELPAALRSASDHFIERVPLRSSLLRSILPPFTFLLIGALVLAFVHTVITPLVSMLQGLS